MDRKMLLFALVVFGIQPALGGTVFVAPEFPTRLEPGENYQESRFGQPPARPDLGGGVRMAANEAYDAALDDAGPSRRPAGLEMRGERRRAPLEEPAPPTPQPPVLESAAARKGVQEIALIAGDLGYFPKTVFVSRDIPVRMFVTGASKNTLCLMMDSFQVRRQVRAQKIEEITFMPSMPGKYRFYCPVNGMEGTLIVKELASAPGVE
ncbi:MAG: cupredoxin domain-containing protein [Oligoflexia bacterium]|nr:cupredoxin domain-containing protein [Oligoflexia bacterium]